MNESIKLTPKHFKLTRGFPAKIFSDEEIIEFGEKMFRWMELCDSDSKCNVVHLSEFYHEVMGFDRLTWKDQIASRKCFHPYYECAMDWMAKRTMKNRDLPTAYGSRFLGIYSKDVRDHEREIVKEEIDLNAAKNNMVPPQDKDIASEQALLDKIAEQQRTIDELKRQADQKHQRSDQEAQSLDRGSKIGEDLRLD